MWGGGGSKQIVHIFSSLFCAFKNKGPDNITERLLQYFYTRVSGEALRDLVIPSKFQHSVVGSEGHCPGQCFMVQRSDLSKGGHDAHSGLLQAVAFTHCLAH